MVSQIQAVGVVLLIFGVPGAFYPYRVARFEERVQAIGSKRSWDEVEPTEWRVGLTRALGVVMTAVGALWTVSG